MTTRRGPTARPERGGDFRRFWAASTTSAFGTQVTLLALQALVITTLDGTAQDAGWLGSARWAPYLVLGLVVGALVDRVRRRPLLVGTDLLRAVLLAAIPLAWWTGVLSLPLLLVVVTCFGAASLVHDGAWQSSIPRLVPRADLQRAHARLDGSDAVAQTGGPALGGALVSAVGAPLAVLVDAASFVVSAVLVASIRAPEPAPDRASRPHLRREVAEGVRWVYERSGLARLAVATHVWFAGQAALTTVLAPFVLLTLDLSALQLGLGAAAGGAGAVVGAAVSGRLGRRLGTGGAIIATHLLSVVGALVLAAAGLGTTGWSALAVVAAGQALSGVGLGAANSHEMAYRQALTPDGLQARTAITMRSANRAVVVVAAPLAGLLAVQTSDRTALLIAATVFATSAVVLAASPFRHARTRVD